MIGPAGVPLASSACSDHAAYTVPALSTASTGKMLAKLFLPEAAGGVTRYAFQLRPSWETPM